MRVLSVLVAVWACAVLVSAQAPCLNHHDPTKLDMFGLINMLYWKADSNRDGTITQPELQTIWDAFDQNTDNIITPQEFIPSWSAVTTMPQELSKAYFFLADLDDNGQITTTDLQQVYQRFDINGDGTVTAEEFNLKWQQLYREAPFAVLYLRADTNKDDDLQKDEFSHLFGAFNHSADGSVTKAQFIQGWTCSDFGDVGQATGVFTGLDTDHNGQITVAEMTALFPTYDLSHNGKVELLELIGMSNLVPTPAPSA